MNGGDIIDLMAMAVSSTTKFVPTVSVLISTGREARGIFASVYLDYRNPDGSTAHTLNELEWNMGALLS